MHENELSVLSKQNLLSGYNGTGMEFCEYFMFRKQTRVEFNKTTMHLTREKLDYIHSDLWGPKRLASKNGA